MDNTVLHLRVLAGLNELPSSSWNISISKEKEYASKNSDITSKLKQNPFMCWEFLQALEQSECASYKTGWSPCHLVLEDQCQNLLAAMPLYLKNHSYGEYVFDQTWSEVSNRLNCQPYYPKLQTSIPFTPVTSSKLLTHQEKQIKAFISGALSIAEKTNASSWHITFPDEQETSSLIQMGFLQRKGIQFHFKNKSYRDFNDFLDHCKSHKRKMIKKERQVIQKKLTLKRFSGKEITNDHMDKMYEFYQNTCERKWSHVYLNRSFFKLIHQRLYSQIILVFACEQDEYVGGALYFFDDAVLYGRYWGAIQQIPFLHFELCYYQAIEICIEKKLSKINAGAQGFHKLLKGFEPVETYSLHWIADDRLRNIIYHFLQQENKEIERQITNYHIYLPFHV